MDDARWLLALAAGGAGAWAFTRPYGSWSGAVRMFSRRPAVGLTVVRLSSLPPGWAANLGSFDFVSAKVMDGRSPYRPDETAAILGPARNAGCAAQGWGFHYIRDLQAGADEGSAAAARALALGLGAYWLNAEKHWLGREGEPATADPVGAIAAFVASFRAQAPGIPLIFNGYAGPKLRPAGIEDREVEIASMFDAWGPMAYATTRSSVAEKFRHAAEVARAAGVKLTPMVGTGRHHSGSQFWGYAYASGGVPGLLDMARAESADWIAFYAGNLAGANMIAAGNDENPALADLSDALKARQVTT